MGQKMVTMFNSKNKPIKISTEYYQQVLQCLNVEICTFNKQLLTENKARDIDISRLAFQQKSEPEVKEQSEGKEGHKKIGRPQAIECLANKETATTMLNSEEYLDSDEKVGTANEKSVPIKHDKSKALLSDHLVKKSDASSLQSESYNQYNRIPKSNSNNSLMRVIDKQSYETSREGIMSACAEKVTKAKDMDKSNSNYLEQKRRDIQRKLDEMAEEKRRRLVEQVKVGPYVKNEMASNEGDSSFETGDIKQTKNRMRNVLSQVGLVSSYEMIELEETEKQLASEENEVLSEEKKGEQVPDVETIREKPKDEKSDPSQIENLIKAHIESYNPTHM